MLDAMFTARRLPAAPENLGAPSSDSDSGLSALGDTLSH